MPIGRAVTLPLVTPIVPVLRDQPFDDPAYLFEPKYDGFRGLLYLPVEAGERPETVRPAVSLGVGGSCGSRKRFSMARSCRWIRRAGRTSAVSSPAGETSIYAAFDVLWLNGKDLRGLPLTRRKRALERIVPATTTVLSRVFAVEGRGRDLFAAAERLDLQGIVAQRKADPCAPTTVWFKVRSRAYTQMEGRGDLFYPRGRSG